MKFFSILSVIFLCYVGEVKAASTEPSFEAKRCAAQGGTWTADSSGTMYCKRPTKG